MAPTRGGQTGSYLTSPYQVTVSYGNASAGIIQNTGADWFGPLNPITPIAPPEVAGRQWDYPSGFNLQTTPRTYEPIGFPTLRGLADGYDILRTIIETRKDQVARMAWSIKAKDPKAKQANDTAVAAATAFLKKPDGIHCWADWLRLVLEDLFVIDAPTLFLHRDRGGKLLGLLPLDGATIKPVIDDWGRTPQPYMQDGVMVWPVAYQQVLKGYPAVDYSVRDLIYRPRNVRANRAYGFSPVEQIVTTVNIALRRQLFLLDYYTDGNIPDSMIGCPESWTPDQIANYQKYWDAYFDGNLGRRRRAKFVPGGIAKTFVQTKEPELKNDFDEWLIKIVCFAFSVSPQPFIKQMNRASAETQKNMAEEEGLAPILDWIKTVIDDLLLTEFDLPGVEFSWGEDEQVDETAQAVILGDYTSNAIMRINEARAKLGLDPDPDPAANMLMVKTPTGYVPLNANTIEGKQANLDAFGPPPPNAFSTGKPGRW